MLKLVKNNKELDVDKKSFYVDYKEDGTKTLNFQLSIFDEILKDIYLEDTVEFDKLYYVIKERNDDNENASFVCMLDRDDFKSDLFTSYKRERMTEKEMFDELCNGVGWTVIGSSNGLRRTLEVDDLIRLDVIIEVSNIFECYIDFDNYNKILYFEYPKKSNTNGFFISEQVNLRKKEHNSDTYDIATRIYGYGKKNDDTGEYLTFSSINNGKEYVENLSYKNKVITKIIRDERFTDKQSLLDYCNKELSKLYAPIESFELDIINLSKLDHSHYHLYDYKVRDLVDYVDINADRRVTHRIVQITEYPFMHENDKIILSNNPITLEKLINSSDTTIKNIEKENSTFLQKAKEDATALLNAFATKGYRYDTENETYFLDTLPKENAKYVMRMNLGGIAFSSSGINGTYTTAWTIDGKFNADFINVGTLEGIRIIADTGKIGGFEIKSDGIYATFIRKIPNNLSESDKTRIRNIIEGNVTPSEDDYVRLDIDADGRISAADYVLITNILNGKVGLDWKYTFKITPQNGLNFITYTLERGGSDNSTIEGHISLSKIDTNTIIDINKRIANLEAKVGV